MADALMICRCGLAMFAIPSDDDPDDGSTWHYVCDECDGYRLDDRGQIVPR